MILEVLKETSLITALVLVIMLIIEYINVGSHGHWFGPLQKSQWKQYLFSALACAIPGCVGPILTSTLFLHRMIGVGALVASLVISFGDEAFVLYASNPEAGLLLTFCLIIVGIPLGIISQKILNRRLNIPAQPIHFKVHGDEHCHNKMANQNKKRFFSWEEMSFERALLLLGHGLILIGIFAGTFGHDNDFLKTNEAGSTIFLGLGWEQLIFLVLTLFSLYIVATVPEHFLAEHLWHHLIRKHFLRILLWTFGALLLVELLSHNLDINNWLHDNYLIILILAALIGIIPQSGPHLVFIALFISGSLPFSVLLINSIVQEGHGALPLFAESKRNFFLIKAIKITIALPLGYFLYRFGF
jgi:hypothetical protein